MTTNLFNSDYLKNKGGMDGVCDCVTINIAGKELEGLVAQNVVFQYQRQPQAVFEIGSCNYYYIDARPSGTLTVSNIIGPTKQSLNTFLDLGTDICKPAKVTFTPTTCSCEGGRAKAFTVDGAILNSLSITVVADNPSMQGQWTYMFVNLYKS